MEACESCLLRVYHGTYSSFIQMLVASKHGADAVYSKHRLDFLLGDCPRAFYTPIY